MKRLLLSSYIVLGTILITTLAAAYFDGPYLTSPFVKDISKNLATEVIGIGLTVFLIDRVIKRQQEAELRKYRQVALLRLRNPLARHAEFLFKMFKATIETKPKIELVEVSDLFDNGFFTNVALLDFRKPAPISIASIGRINWATYLVIESKSLDDSLNQSLDKYSVYLKVELIEMIERMLEKNFNRFVAVLQGEVASGGLGKVTQPYPGFAELTEAVVEPHFRTFQVLVHYFNNQVDEEHKVNLKGQTWGNHVAPIIGSARAPTPAA